jgi:hypothetical protein
LTPLSDESQYSPANIQEQESRPNLMLRRLSSLIGAELQPIPEGDLTDKKDRMNLTRRHVGEL